MARYETLLTNVTEALQCVISAFLGECDPGGCIKLFFSMTYPFGATKADLEKAFRRPDAHVVRESQLEESLELAESDLAVVMFEHPDI